MQVNYLTIRRGTWDPTFSRANGYNNYQVTKLEKARMLVNQLPVFLIATTGGIAGSYYWLTGLIQQIQVIVVWRFMCCNYG